MDHRNIPWKSEWKAAGLDPGPLTSEEEALVPELKQANEAFLRAHPFQKRARISRIALGTWALPLAAAAAVLLFVTVPNNAVQTPETSLERMKGVGDPGLVVYRQTKEGTEKLKAGSVVKPGDVLQVAYRVSQPVQGALVSVDGNRNITIHLASQGRSTALTTGGERPLQFSYELDRAPRFEVFFLFVSDQPFDLEPLRQTLKTVPLESLSPTAFGPRIQFTSLALAKDVTP